MQFKKVLFGGYDKKDVQEKLNALQNDFDSKINALKADFEKSEKAFNDKLNELTTENESLVIKQQEMRVAYKEYCENTLQQYASSLRSLSNEFSQILDNVVNLQKEIVSKDIFGEMDRALEMKQMYDALEEVEKED